MLRPEAQRELYRYDNLTPVSAVLAAWRDPGSSNYWRMKAHYVLQNMVRSLFPTLARALDRAVYGEFFLDSLEYRNAVAAVKARRANRHVPVSHSKDDTTRVSSRGATDRMDSQHAYTRKSH